MITYRICLCLTYFTKHNTIWVYLFQMARFLFFLYSWVVFHCAYIPQLLYLFICWWTLRLLPYLGCCVINNAAVNTECMYLFGLAFLFFSDIYPGVELLDHMVVLFAVFWGTSILFHSGYPNLHSHQGFPFLYILTNFCYLYSFWW